MKKFISDNVKCEYIKPTQLKANMLKNETDEARFQYLNYNNQNNYIYFEQSKNKYCIETSIPEHDNIFNYFDKFIDLIKSINSDIKIKF